MSSHGEPASGLSTPPNGNEKAAGEYNGDYGKPKVFNFRVIIMGLLVSLGGFIFGWEGGSISGYTQMANFKQRFGDVEDSGSLKLGNVRQGLLTGMLCVGCLIGALVSAPIADRFGRKYSITFWNIIYIVGNIICITTQYKWYQIVIGRLVDGFGIGALSVLTPMYQSETAPRQVRGALVSAYQLFITLGIFVAYCVNFGTEGIQSPASWRITMGVGFIAPTVMAIGMLVMRESPRWEFRRGGEVEAAKTLALVSGVPEEHPEVQNALRDIRENLEAERAGGEQKWYEIFTAPAMLRRVAIGMSLQALQQLTGANFFFYYGTEIFDAVGISNSYITSMILGCVNVVSTFGGLYVGQKFGRRISMIIGGIWMFAWLLIFASLGSFALYPDNNPNDPNARTNSAAGSAMIASACMFIVGFAVTVSFPMIKQTSTALPVVPILRTQGSTLLTTLKIVGSSRLGHRRRDVPFALPCCGHGSLHCCQLVVELPHLLLHSLDHRCHQLPLWLCLRRLLLPRCSGHFLLRQRVPAALSRGGRLHVHPGSRSLEECFMEASGRACQQRQSALGSWRPWLREARDSRCWTPRRQCRPQHVICVRW